MGYKRNNDNFNKFRQILDKIDSKKSQQTQAKRQLS